MENLLVEVVASQVLSNHRVLLGTYCREPVSTVASVGDIREGSLHGRRRCWNRQHHARQRCENFHRLILRRVLLPPGQHVLLSVHRIGLEPAGQFAELLLDVFSKPNFVLNVLGVQYNPIRQNEPEKRQDRRVHFVRQNPHRCRLECHAPQACPPPKDMHSSPNYAPVRKDIKQQLTERTFCEFCL
jgi:hypothetical protein